MLPAISRLALTDFRGYGRLDLTPDPDGFIVLTGHNGAGKTNLLEALSFLSPGRGFRRAALSEIERLGGPGTGWGVAATLDTDQGPIEIGTGKPPGGSERRILKLNGSPAKSQTELSDLLVVSWLTPAMDRLFQEGSSGRRRFLDRMVQGFDSNHAPRLSAYEHAMRERLRLLKERRADPSWLTALEEAMAREGVAVAVARTQLLSRLQTAVEGGIGPFPAADIALDGEIETALASQDAATVEVEFRAALSQRRRIDADAGATTHGPHRGDLLVRHRAKNMPAPHCSTGEQKALLLALLLANARLVKAARGLPPLLLLDEVAAHLDEERRAALFDELTALGGQAWLTGTDRALFNALEARGRYYTVEDGAVRLSC
ncbi:DNA replication/repair protein RecF [Lacibacterium aquatile]|uniref:DNA replication and repair protein RecF n=1 Tax=Lacibacterium aquatile TaxID=1168082 RepID=A0ABW5DMS5_9PROT